MLEIKNTRDKDMKKTLAEIKNGETVIITDCLDIATKCMVMRFGLAVGETVKCITKVGPIILGKNKQTIAIGKNLACKIFIQAA